LEVTGWTTGHARGKGEEGAHWPLIRRRERMGAGGRGAGWGQRGEGKEGVGAGGLAVAGRRGTGHDSCTGLTGRVQCRRMSRGSEGEKKIEAVGGKWGMARRAQLEEMQGFD
jgi:hypothetical protein